MAKKKAPEVIPEEPPEPVTLFSVLRAIVNKLDIHHSETEALHDSIDELEDPETEESK